MKCPKCGLTQPDDSLECLRCGVVFAKIGLAPRQSRTPSEPADHSRTRESGRTTERRRDFPPIPVPKQRPSEARGEDRRVGEIRLGRSRTGSGPTATGRQTGMEPALPDVDLVADEGSPTTAYFDDEADFVPEVRTLDKNDWLVLASGPLTALIIMFIPFVSHIFATLGILIHEMGHAMVGWLLGYPSVPAFDLRYGGGVTLHLERSAALLAVFYGFMAFAMYTYRKNISTLIFLGVVLVVHIVISVTSLKHIIILFMGHGMELVIAGVFFYRALSGAAVVHAVERPLYSAISFFLVFWDIRFAFRLMTSAEHRIMYGEAKGGGHWMDFSRIAQDHLLVDLRTVALFFFICCFVPLIIGFLCFRYQEYLRVAVQRLAMRDPSARGEE